MKPAAYSLMIILLLCLTVLFHASAVSAAEEKQPDYCDDVQSWQEWENLLQKHPDDDGISSLYAFRVGLCVMVRTGRIETAQAINLFEKMRQAILNSMNERKQVEKNAQENEGAI